MIWTEMMPFSRLLAVRNSPTGENGIPTFKVESDATEGKGDAKLHARLDQGRCLTAGKLWPPLGGPDAGSPEEDVRAVAGGGGVGGGWRCGRKEPGRAGDPVPWGGEEERSETGDVIDPIQRWAPRPAFWCGAGVHSVSLSGLSSWPHSFLFACLFVWLGR
jgi:hypothetical protein